MGNGRIQYLRVLNIHRLDQLNPPHLFWRSIRDAQVDQVGIIQGVLANILVAGIDPVAADRLKVDIQLAGNPFQINKVLIRNPAFIDYLASSRLQLLKMCADVYFSLD